VTRRCPLCRLLRRGRQPDRPAPPSAPVPARLTAQALAEAVALIAAGAYGVDVSPPDPAVPARDVEAALAGIAVAVLEERFADRGARYLAKLGHAAARLISDQAGGNDHDQP